MCDLSHFIGLRTWVLVVKKLPANAGGIRDMGLIPRSGRSPGAENGNPFQHSCLENSMDRGAWWAIVYGAARSTARLSVRTHTHTHLILCFNRFLKVSE